MDESVPKLLRERLRPRRKRIVLISTGLCLLAIAAVAVLLVHNFTGDLIVVGSIGTYSLVALTGLVGLLSAATALFVGANLNDSLSRRVLLRLFSMVPVLLIPPTLLVFAVSGFNGYVHVGTLPNGERLVIEETAALGDAVYAPLVGRGVVFTPLPQIMSHSPEVYTPFADGDYTFQVEDGQAVLKYAIVPSGTLSETLVIRSE